MYGCLYGGRRKDFGAIYKSSMGDRDKSIYCKRGGEAKVEEGWNRAMKTENKHDRELGEMTEADNATCGGKSYDKKNNATVT